MPQVVIVYDGKAVTTPEVMGKPSEGQLQGSELDKLAELCGRVSYDSLGRGRASPDFHENLRTSRHFSVYRHGTLTFTVDLAAAPWPPDHLWVLLGRPGVFPTGLDGFRLNFVVNLQAAMQWGKWPCLYPKAQETNELLGQLVWKAFHEAAPLSCGGHGGVITKRHLEVCPDFKTVAPRSDREIYASVFLSDISRVAADELLRHSFECAPSMECLAGDTLVKFRHTSHGKAGTTVWRSIEHLHELWLNKRLHAQVGKMNIQVYNEIEKRFVLSKVTDVRSSGIKACYKVTLKDGKQITCSRDHKLFTDRGWMTLDEICHPFVSPQRICCWDSGCEVRIATNGISTRTNVKLLDEAWLKEQYLDLCRTMQEIADELGVPKTTVNSWITKHGIPRRGIILQGNGLNTDKQWLYERYYVDDLSIPEMAALAECSEAVIRNWLRKFGLQKRIEELHVGKPSWNKGVTYRHKKPRTEEHRKNIGLAKRGELHPNWKGGVESEGRRAFGRWKLVDGNFQKILARDGFRCRLCDRPATEIPPYPGPRPRCLDINHIIPIWADSDRACDTGNMITLCWECHCKKVNNHEFEYAEQFFEMIETPVQYIPTGLTRPGTERPVRAKFNLISKVEYVGEIPTFDIEVEGPNHGFVAGGVVVHNSTRYIDYSKRPWIFHPLLHRPGKEFDWIRDTARKIEQHCRAAYNGLCNSLTALCPDAGIKQVRGAARGVIALSAGTRLIFSASLAAWRGIFKLRISDHADEEIRIAMTQVRDVLKARWPTHFSPEE